MSQTGHQPRNLHSSHPATAHLRQRALLAAVEVRALHKGQRLEVHVLAARCCSARAARLAAALALAQPSRLLANGALHRALPLTGCTTHGGERSMWVSCKVD